MDDKKLKRGEKHHRVAPRLQPDVKDFGSKPKKKEKKKEDK